MSATATGELSPAKDPHMPKLVRLGDVIAPKAPQTIAAAGLEGGKELTDLVLRLGHTVSRFTTDWVAKQLHLAPALAREVLDKLAYDGLVEQLWQTSEASAHYKISEQGHEAAERVLDLCGYIGPAPVSLEAYGAMLRWQFANTPQV